MGLVIALVPASASRSTLRFPAADVSAGDKVSYPWQAWSTLTVAPYVGLYTDYRFSTDSALPVGVPFHRHPRRLVNGVPNVADGPTGHRSRKVDGSLCYPPRLKPHQQDPAK